MKIILDTNVLVSGVFFRGPPWTILEAWRAGAFRMVLSTEILDEYRRVLEVLSKRFDLVDLRPLLELIAISATVVEAPPMSERVCSDPDDDKFIACAVASGTRLIVSGDKALLRTSGYRRIFVLTPRDFLARLSGRRRHRSPGRG